MRALVGRRTSWELPGVWPGRTGGERFLSPATWALACPAGALELRRLSSMAAERAWRVHPVERGHLLGARDVPREPWAQRLRVALSLVQHLFEARSEGPRALVGAVHRACILVVSLAFRSLAATKGEGHACCCTKACAHQRPNRTTEHAHLSAFSCSQTNPPCKAKCFSRRRASTSEPDRLRRRRP